MRPDRVSDQDLPRGRPAMECATVLTAAEIDRMESDLERVIPSAINDIWDPYRIVKTLRALQRGRP